MASHGTRITYKLISLLSQNGNCCVTLAEQYSSTISTKIKTKKKTVETRRRRTFWESTKCEGKYFDKSFVE